MDWTGLNLEPLLPKRHSFANKGTAINTTKKYQSESYLRHHLKKRSNAKSLNTMSSSFSPSTATSSNVFENGKYMTVLQTIESATCTTKSPIPVPPPKPLLICMPTDAGQFPVLLLLHGYLLLNSFYSQLLQHVASHGFIVIAPQV